MATFKQYLKIQHRELKDCKKYSIDNTLQDQINTVRCVAGEYADASTTPRLLRAIKHTAHAALLIVTWARGERIEKIGRWKDSYIAKGRPTDEFIKAFVNSGPPSTPISREHRTMFRWSKK